MNINIKEINETIEIHKEDILNNRMLTNDLLVDDIVESLGYSKKRDKAVKRIYNSTIDWDIKVDEHKLAIRVQGYGAKLETEELDRILSECKDKNFSLVLITDGSYIDIYRYNKDSEGYLSAKRIDITSDINEQESLLIECISKCGFNLSKIDEIIKPKELTVEQVEELFNGKIEEILKTLIEEVYTEYTNKDKAIEEFLFKLKEPKVIEKVVEKVVEKKVNREESINEELIKMLKSSNSNDISYACVINGKLMHYDKLHTFVGRVLQKLYEIKNFEASSYIFNGSIFRLNGENVIHNDLIINNKVYDVVINEDEYEDALQKLSIIFSKFGDIDFYCNKLGNRNNNQNTGIDEASLDSLGEFDENLSLSDDTDGELDTQSDDTDGGGELTVDELFEDSLSLDDKEESLALDDEEESLSLDEEDTNEEDSSTVDELFEDSLSLDDEEESLSLDDEEDSLSLDEEDTNDGDESTVDELFEDSLSLDEEDTDEEDSSTVDELFEDRLSLDDTDGEDGDSSTVDELFEENLSLDDEEDSLSLDEEDTNDGDESTVDELFEESLSLDDEADTDDDESTVDELFENTLSLDDEDDTDGEDSLSLDDESLDTLIEEALSLDNGDRTPVNNLFDEDGDLIEVDEDGLEEGTLENQAEADGINVSALFEDDNTEESDVDALDIIKDSDDSNTSTEQNSIDVMEVIKKSEENYKNEIDELLDNTEDFNSINTEQDNANEKFIVAQLLNIDNIIWNDGIKFKSIKYVGTNSVTFRINCDKTEGCGKLTSKILDAVLASQAYDGDNTIISKIKKCDLSRTNNFIKYSNRVSDNAYKLNGTRFSVVDVETIPQALSIVYDICNALDIKTNETFIYMNVETDLEYIESDYGFCEDRVETIDSDFYKGTGKENNTTAVLKADIFNNTIVTKNSLQAYKDMLVRVLAIKTKYLGQVIREEKDVYDIIKTIINEGIRNAKDIDTDLIGNILGENYKILSLDESEVSDNAIKIEANDGKEYYCSRIDYWKVLDTVAKIHTSIFKDGAIAVRYVVDIDAVNYYGSDFETSEPSLSLSIKSLADYIAICCNGGAGK